MTDTLTRSCSACFSEIDPRATRCPHCAQRQTDQQLHRDVPGRLLGGVCASLAQHFGLDLTLTRVLFVASLAVTGGLAFWVYASLWLMTPFGRADRAPLARFFDGVANVFSTPAKPPRPEPMPGDLR